MSKVGKIGYKLQASCIPIVVVAHKAGSEAQLKSGSVEVSRGFLEGIQINQKSKRKILETHRKIYVKL